MTDDIPFAREEWRAIQGFEGHYEVSNRGNVRSLERIDGIGRKKKAMPLKPLYKKGYPFVTLSKMGVVRQQQVHRLVGEAFIGPLPKGMTTNHIDGNKANADVRNLEYVTQADNNRHAFATGLQPVGERRNSAKLTDDHVRLIRQLEKTMPRKQLAAKFNVAENAIYQVTSGKTWKHVI